MISLKKLSLSIFTLIAGSSLFAQTTDDSKFQDLLPKEGDYGTSIIIDGLLDNINLESTSNEYGQNILFLKYYLKDDLVLRAGLGFNYQKLTRESSDSIGVVLEERDSIVSGSVFNLSVGVEKHLSASKRLDPFLFSQMDFSFIGKSNFETEVKNTSSVGTSSVKEEFTQDGGIAFGLQFGGGFNYFFAPKFSIGAEMALRLQYASVGGTISGTQTTTSLNGNTTSVFQSREDLVKETNIDVEPNALINISYFF